MGALFGEITIAVELVVIAMGFVVLHHNRKEKALLLKVAAYILIVGGSLLFIGTGYRLASLKMGGHHSSGWQGHHMGMGAMEGRRGGRSLFRPFNKRASESEKPAQKESK